MKTIIKNIIFLTLSVYSLSSCYKDKGNYDYIELDTINIDTSKADIKPTYALYRYDTLRIAPKVYVNGQLSSNEPAAKNKLSFTWSIYQSNVAGGTIYSRDTISNALKLEKPITKPVGTWTLLLSVKDLDTQVETYQKFEVRVDEAISDGWMVLYEKDGNTDVGLIVDARIRPGTINDRIFADLIKNTNGNALEGKPISLLQSASALTSREVIVASEKDMRAYTHTNFQQFFSFNQFFFGPPNTVSPKVFTANIARKELLINDNKVYAANFSTGTTRTILFGLALLGDYGELDTWSPKLYAQSFNMVAYDKTNKKFVYATTNTVSDFTTQTSATAEWQPNNVGLDMKAYDFGRNNYEYMIMGNASNTYLLTGNFMAASEKDVAVKKYNMTAAPDISNLSAMASSSTGSYILYGAGEKLYRYLYDGTSDISNVWSAPSGEKITSVRFLRFYFPTVQTLKLAAFANQSVYIATYNETTKEGKVYNVKIDPTSGTIDPATQKVYEGFGEIKDMSYKWVI